MLSRQGGKARRIRGVACKFRIASWKASHRPQEAKQEGASQFGQPMPNHASLKRMGSRSRTFLTFRKRCSQARPPAKTMRGNQYLEPREAEQSCPHLSASIRVNPRREKHRAKQSVYLHPCTSDSNSLLAYGPHFPCRMQVQRQSTSIGLSGTGLRVSTWKLARRSSPISPNSRVPDSRSSFGPLRSAPRAGRLPSESRTTLRRHHALGSALARNCG
jgi:hypothetical protein